MLSSTGRALPLSHALPSPAPTPSGVDNVDSYSHLSSFVRVVSEGSPVSHFIIHARKCLLKGLSPHQNRTVPPLRYEWLVALKRDFPHLHFTLNGGVQTLQEARSALTLQRADPCWTPGAESTSSSSNGSSSNSSSSSSGSGSDAGEMAVGGGRSGEGVGRNGDGMGELDTARFGQLDIAGVMIGRAAYNAPWDVLADADRSIYGADCNACTSRRQVSVYTQWMGVGVGVSGAQTCAWSKFARFFGIRAQFCMPAVLSAPQLRMLCRGCLVGAGGICCVC
jgi:tRNA-dihydrouridine synthase